MKDINVIGYVMLALLAVPVVSTVFSDRITDWLIARQDRKKSAEPEADPAAEPEAGPAADPA